MSQSRRSPSPVADCRLQRDRRFLCSSSHSTSRTGTTTTLAIDSRANYALARDTETQLPRSSQKATRPVQDVIEQPQAEHYRSAMLPTTADLEHGWNSFLSAANSYNPPSQEVLLPFGDNRQQIYNLQFVEPEFCFQTSPGIQAPETTRSHFSAQQVPQLLGGGQYQAPYPSQQIPLSLPIQTQPSSYAMPRYAPYYHDVTGLPQQPVPFVEKETEITKEERARRRVLALQAAKDLQERRQAKEVSPIPLTVEPTSTPIGGGSRRLSPEIVNYLKDFMHQKYIPHLLESDRLTVTSQESVRRIVNFLQTNQCDPSSTKIKLCWDDLVEDLRKPGWLSSLSSFLRLSLTQTKEWLRRFRSRLLKELMEKEGMPGIHQRHIVSCRAYKECTSSGKCADEGLVRLSSAALASAVAVNGVSPGRLQQQTTNFPGQALQLGDTLPTGAMGFFPYSPRS